MDAVAAEWWVFSVALASSLAQTGGSVTEIQFLTSSWCGKRGCDQDVNKQTNQPIYK